MNVPNLITTSRLLVTFAVLICLEVTDAANPDVTLIWWVFGMFMYAAGSDFVDGWFARKYGQETALGRVIDPFADKFLICGTMIAMLRFNQHLDYEPWEGFSSNALQSWMVVVIVSREFFVTTIRSVAEAQGVKFPAENIGKLKMVAQCTAVSAQLTMIAGCELYNWFGFWFMWVTLVLAVWSALGYAVKAKPVLSGK